ncbi:MAG: T9SS type A sorting domain-containing protein [Saprospiraceae bacterium]
MKKKILFLALWLTARLLSAQNQDSCFANIWTVPNSSGFVTLHASSNDTLLQTGILWNTGETAATIVVDSPGTYCVTITQSTGCTATACYTWSTTPCAVAIFEDSLGLLVAGPTNAIWPYQFHWSTGSWSQSIQSAGPGLTYCVTLTDAIGCTSTACVTTTYGNCSTDIDISADTLTGNVTLTAAPNGVPPFAYLWSNGATTSAISVTANSGPFTLTVTDAVGCVATNSSDFNGDSCQVYILQANGQMTAHFVGWGATTFTWSNGQTGPTIAPTAPGNYCVTATNAFGCSGVACQNFNGTTPDCNLTVGFERNPTTGYLAAVPQNGTAPYAFRWGHYNYTTQEVAFFTERLPYTVTITDAEGCTNTGVYNDSTCFLSMTYEMTETGRYLIKTINSGVGRIEMDWSNGYYSVSFGGGGHSIVVDSPGLYCVTITDEIGCAKTACVNLPNCSVKLFPEVDGDIAAAVFGAQPIVLTWSEPGLSGNPITPPAGWDTLQLTITDANGCVASDYIAANYPPPPACSVYIQRTLGVPDTVELTAVASDWLNVVSYAWNTGETAQYITTETAGNYCVTATYANGCVADTCLVLSAGASLQVNVKLDGPGGSADADGELWLIAYDPAQGGTLTAIDTVPLVNGKGKFEQIPLGDYIVKASLSPQSPVYQSYIPTYWHEAALWSDAQSVEVDHPFKQSLIFLTMLEGQNPGGPGFIGGLVSEGANLQAGEGEAERGSGQPLAGVCILLTLPDGTPVGHATTDANGSFQLPNLPLGTYHVWVDIPGLEPVFVEVVLTAANPSVSNVYILVDEDSAAVTLDADDLKNDPSNVHIYPNPANDVAQIVLEKWQNQRVRISVLNSLGGLVFEQNSDEVVSPTHSLDVADWPNGQYFVVVETSNGKKSLGKLVVLHSK